LTNIYVEAKKRRRKSGRKILTIEHRDLIKTYIDEDCTLSLQAIANRLRDQHGITASISTIDRVIFDFRYTLKRTCVIPERRNEANNLKERRTYASTFLSLLPEQDGENILFLDEVGFNVSMRTKRGEIIDGYPSSASCSWNKKSQYFRVLCYNKNGTLYYKKQDHPFNRETFMGFLNGLFDKLLERNMANSIFIMDNMPFHRSNEIRSSIVEKDT
jgi:hypothetical protein